MTHMKVFVVSFRGRKLSRLGDPSDAWRMTVEAVDETHAEWKVRDLWHVDHELVVEEQKP